MQEPSIVEFSERLCSMKKHLIYLKHILFQLTAYAVCFTTIITFKSSELIWLHLSNPAENNKNLLHSFSIELHRDYTCLELKLINLFKERLLRNKLIYEMNL